MTLVFRDENRSCHLAKRSQYFNPTYCYIVGCNIHPVATCCDMLGVVGSNLKMVKFFMQQLDVAWCCSRLARFVQQCCAWTCALDATGWPNTCNMLPPTMLRSAAFKCCDRLAGACKCWANNVGMCCVEMLLSFGQGFTIKWKLHCRNRKQKRKNKPKTMFDSGPCHWLVLPLRLPTPTT